MTDYVRTAAGVARFHEPIGSPIVRQRLRPHVNGPRHITHDPDVTDRSINTQEFAQQRASSWYNRTTGLGDEWGGLTFDSMRYDYGKEDDPLWAAAALWSEYQMPEHYGKISASLREGTPVDGFESDTVREMANVLFNSPAAYAVPQDIVLYRALKGKRSGMPQDTDWTKVLTVGAVFEDKGIVSTTALPESSEGWLYLEHDGYLGREVQLDDVIMEIRVPAGTKVVGGNTFFIETMLAPGTKFRVLSSEVRRTKPEDPLSSTWPRGEMPPAPYTHVVVELVP